MNYNGKIIVIEGLDGSGKATQSDLLYQYFIKRGTPVYKTSFPDYESQSSALVKMYLNGEFGDRPNDVNAYAASSFYAVDRYASYKTKWKNLYEQGYTVICDRYTTSNMIHQCSKLPVDQWEVYLNWLATYEYCELGIPKPDIVIYLHTSVIEDNEKLMDNRYDGDQSKKDIHERDMDYLVKCKAAGEYCASKQNWLMVECTETDKEKKMQQIRSVEDIHKDIISLLS